jgi:hypothetical protein
MTAKKRMVAKLHVIKAELQYRKHHRTCDVGAWLRKVVQGYYQYHAVPGNTSQLRVFRRRVLVRRSQRAQVGWDRLNPHDFISGASVEVKQSADGVILKIPVAADAVVDRVIVLKLAP